MTINVTRRAALIGLSTCIGAGACADNKQVQRRRGFADTRAAGSLRRRCEYGKPEGNRAEGPATGLAPEGGSERRRLSSDEYFHRVPAQRKRGRGDNDLIRKRFLTRLSHLRRGKI